uniref:Uncharacterized protein n=1 Tax=Rhizophora mucronata TaxID=61149 RepID=A0A2P2QSH1_RHIMU
MSPHIIKGLETCHADFALLFAKFSRGDVFPQWYLVPQFNSGVQA